MTAGPRVGVVGGGILGTVVALRLAEAGARVTLVERADSLGGLAGAMDFAGHTVDRFYHVIVPSDRRMIAMAEELGLADELRFSPVGVGFLSGGELHDLNGIVDFLRFGALTPWQRARLAWFVAYCQLRSGYGGLEDVPLERWLRRHCGRGVVERIWRPLLDSRFDGRHDELPATYLWARTRRMSSARAGAERRETMGCLVGGHQRLVDAIARRAIERGVELRLGASVSGLRVDAQGAVRGLVVDGESLDFELTIPTLQPPALARLLPDGLAGLLDAYPRRHLGVVCVLLKVRRSLSPYYSVNICEPTPITTVVEASHVVGTEHTGGLRLIYLPKYCDPDAPEHSEPDEVVYERFTGMLARVSPNFSREADVVDWTVQRAKLVEPVHALGHRPRVAPVWPGVPGLALASNAQVYPRLLNGESVMTLAEGVAAQATTRLGIAGEGVRPLGRAASAAPPAGQAAA
jgi:protoporphyrinogen oxidase